MAQAPQEKEPEDLEPQPEAQEKQAHPAFDFFRGCKASPRPDWGPKIAKFKMPGRPGSQKKPGH